MDFLRNSFLPWGTDESPYERFSGALPAPSSHFVPHFNRAHRIAMIVPLEQIDEKSNEGTADDRQLHAALRDLPLPVGFMRRVRQLVQFGLERAE